MSHWEEVVDVWVFVEDDPDPRWTAGSAVALDEKIDQGQPWSSRRAIRRLLRELTKRRSRAD